LCSKHNFLKIGVAFIFLTYIIEIVGDKWLNSADCGDFEALCEGQMPATTRRRFLLRRKK